MLQLFLKIQGLNNRFFIGYWILIRGWMFILAPFFIYKEIGLIITIHIPLSCKLIKINIILPLGKKSFQHNNVSTRIFTFDFS
jgi:hypothetical protein